jgi:hypothetical protein
MIISSFPASNPAQATDAASAKPQKTRNAFFFITSLFSMLRLRASFQAFAG